METLPGGLEAYVVGDGSKAIVVASDIFGIHLGRHKEICDRLAAQGYLVVMPDFFRGTYQDQGAEITVWKTISQLPGLLTPLNTSWQSVQKALQDSVLPYLQQRGCAAGAGVLGFCWGAWVVVHACAAFPDAFVCGASAHPSVHNMASRWGEDEGEILSKVRAPQLVLASKDEPDSWKPGGAAEKALTSAGGAGHIFKEFSTMSHGFVPRADLKDPGAAGEVSRALEYISGFFGKYLAQPAVQSSA